MRELDLILGRQYTSNARQDSWQLNNQTRLHLLAMFRIQQVVLVTAIDRKESSLARPGLDHDRSHRHNRCWVRCWHLS